LGTAALLRFHGMADPVTPQERAAVLTWFMAQGGSATAQRVARMLGVQPRRAQDLLNELSRVIPIYRTDRGNWQVCAAETQRGCAPVLYNDDGGTDDDNSDVG